jgi:hypothetical protein
MLHMEPGPGRDKLGFKEAVLDNFSFLSSYGFKVVEENVTFVRFESSAVFVDVYHGRASFEIGVHIGLLGDRNGYVSLSDIIAWAGAERAEGFGQHVMFQVSTREGVQEFVPKVSELVNKYAAPFLMGKANAYQAAHAIASRRGGEYAKQVNLSPVRARAETAWHSKNYPQVVELYGSMRDDLTKVEAARLIYAERHLA